MKTRATAAIDSWIRVCLTLFKIYLAVVFVYCSVAFISPSTVGLKTFTFEDFFAFLALGAISVAWWGTPIFLIVAAVIWLAIRASEKMTRRGSK